MSKDKAPMGFNDDDLDRFLLLLEQRALSDLTVKSLVWQFKKQKAKLAECISALEFYADGNGAKDNEIMPNGLYILGKRAREVLARVKK